MELKVKLLRASAKMPTRAKYGDACFDAYACLDETLTIEAGKACKVPLGIAVQLPDASYQIKVLPRSGLNSKGILALTGTVDYGYRGEIQAVIYNSTDETITVEDGVRVCQLDIQRVYDFSLREVSELDDSERGTSGFGSTGE